ncbi:hypothetical protein VM1G_06392 [Cytospora mali]|uniref:DUF5672 domain-containing protein n=1 Tax=Cytospora mali TaxID=578113 RepID=A0A194W328_CYTMA|nr:hypothetical protein VM1G_06392 [Valsa mali]
MAIGMDEYGSRRRHVRTIGLAGAILLIIWVFSSSRLFNSGLSPDLRRARHIQPLPRRRSATDLDTDTDAQTSRPTDIPFPDNVAVIMETDPNRVPNLFPVMLHFANILGPKWPVVLLTLRSKWVEPASPAFRRYMAQRRIHIHFLPEGTAFPDHSSVSLFLTRPWFWEKYESAGRVLMFQADSVLCGRSGRAVDDFLEWDLIGAPISGAYGVGYNGGLSLRNPRMMLQVLRDPANSFARDSASAEVAVVSKPPPAQELKQEVHKPEEHKTEEPKPKVGTGKTEMPRGEVETRAEGEVKSNPPAPAPAKAKPSWMKFEDQWFYMKLKERGAKLPDREVAKTFSVETIYYDKPLGYHQPFRWLDQIQKKQAMEWCPEIGMLQDSSHFFA